MCKDSKQKTVKAVPLTVTSEPKQLTEAAAPVNLSLNFDALDQAVYGQKLLDEARASMSVLQPKSIPAKHQFGHSFQSHMSAGKRSLKTHLPTSTFYDKKQNAKRLQETKTDWEKKQQKLQESRFGRLRKTMGDSFPEEDEKMQKELSAVSVLLEDKRSQRARSDALLQHYAEEDRDETLQTCCDAFLKLDLSRIDLKTDYAFARESARLKAIAEQTAAIKTLLTGNPAFWNSLEEEQKDRLRLRLDAAGRVAEYYKARMALMQNPAYQTKYNSEMTAFASPDFSEEDYETAVLIKKVMLADRRLVHPREGSDEALTEWYYKMFNRNDLQKQFNLHRQVSYERTRFDTSTAANGPMQFLSWLMRSKRTADHGRVRYLESEQKLSLLPQETVSIGDTTKTAREKSWQRGTGPAIDLEKYFQDPFKDSLAASLKAAPVKKETDPPAYENALESLENYTKIHGIVNRDTTEMEMAFLDRFLNEAGLCIEMCKNSTDAHSQEISAFLSDLKSRVETMGRGKLASKMDAEELEYIEKHAEIISEDTTFTANLESSNIQDIPLFLHTPNVNDVKQSTIGDCWLLGALTSLTSADPDFIQEMFHDMGDGSVLVRLYAVLDEAGNPITDRSGYRDTAKTRPVYLRLRKDYETGEGNAGDCAWVQLLEKAYALAGFNMHGMSKVKKGRLYNVAEELTEGDAGYALTHFTGKIHETTYQYGYNPSYLHMMKNEADFSWFFAGMPLFLQKEALSTINGLSTPSEDSLFSMRAYFKMAVQNAVGNVFLKPLQELAEKLAGTDLDPQGITDVLNKVGEQAGFKFLYDPSKKEAERVSLDPDCLQSFLDQLEDNIEALREGKEVKRGGRDTDAFSKESVEEFLRMTLLSVDRSLAALKTPEKTSEKSASQDPAEDPLPQVMGSVETMIKAVFHPGAEDLKKDQLDKRRKDLYDDTDEKMLQDAALQQKEAESLSRARLCARGISVNETQDQDGLGEKDLLFQLKKIIDDHGAAAVMLAGHYVSAIDVTQDQNEWYVLIKDPFNTYNKVYTRDADGKDQMQSEDFSTVLSLYGNQIKRNLAGSHDAAMLGGFRGLSWWKLSDLFRETEGFVPCARISGQSSSGNDTQASGQGT